MYVPGTGHADVLDRLDGVTDEVDMIYGVGGNDHIFGGDDNDYITGGLGADRIDGGDGIDTARYDDSSEGVVVNLATGIGVGGTAEGDKLISIEKSWDRILRTP